MGQAPRMGLVDRVSYEIGQGATSQPWGLPAQLGSYSNTSHGCDRASSPLIHLCPKEWHCHLHLPLCPKLYPQLCSLRLPAACLTLFISELSWKGQLSISSSNFPHSVLWSSSSMEKARLSSILVHGDNKCQPTSWFY